MSKPPPPPKDSFWRLFGKPEEAASITAEDEDPKDDVSSATRFNRDCVYWAMRDLPATEATNHFLVCGTTGSGKTKTIQLFLQSIARRFYADQTTPEQLVIFDAKGDALQLLADSGLHSDGENVYILNPFDARSAVWNVAEAVQTPGMPLALATLLIPEDTKSTARYFTDAAREIVVAVILALNKIKKSDWTLRDLLCSLDSLAHIKAITRRLDGAERKVARYLGDKDHIHGVLSSMASQLGKFETVAALWATNISGKPFSISKFLEKPGVLVLGNDPVLRESFWPFNAILLKSLVNEILRGPEERAPRYWFVLDEFRAMERVDCIRELLNRGRSKGASVLLGIQSIEGLFDVYGHAGTDDLLGLCTSKTFLRSGGPATAEWVERYFNKVRRTEAVVTESSGGSGGSSTSVQYPNQDRPLFLASYFLDLPLPRKGKMFAAVCDIPCLNETVIVQRPFDDVLKLCRDSDKITNLIPRKDAGGLMMKSWADKEENDFLVEPTTADPPKIGPVTQTDPANPPAAPVTTENPVTAQANPPAVPPVASPPSSAPAAPAQEVSGTKSTAETGTQFPLHPNHSISQD